MKDRNTYTNKVVVVVVVKRLILETPAASSARSRNEKDKGKTDKKNRIKHNNITKK